jgi:hypothetical protein
VKESERNQLLEKLYTGEEIFLVYGTHKYLIQGYGNNLDQSVIKVEDYGLDIPETVWTETKDTSDETRDDFLKQPLFDGRTVEDAFSDIVWRDDY